MSFFVATIVAAAALGQTDCLFVCVVGDVKYEYIGLYFQHVFRNE